jgi:Leucine-rich repeat (LRR) protein
MNKFMKSLTAAILSVALVFAMTACDNQGGEEGEPTSDPNFATRPPTPTPPSEDLLQGVVTLGRSGLTDARLQEMVDNGEIPDDTFSIGLSNNNLTDISPLSELKDLVSVNIMNNEITSLSPLSELTELVAINAAGNQITDISALSGLENLMELHLQNNNISDITVLMSMTSLTYVNLYGNNLTAAQINALNEALPTTTVDPRP